MEAPGGAIGHAELEIGDSVVMLPIPVADQFWGDRFGSVQDPFGHSWGIATHVEDLTPEEIAERGRAAMAEMGG